MEEVGHGLLSESERRFLLALNELGVRYQFASSREVDLDGVPVRLLPLERILHSKRSAARSKDEPGIRQIELALEILSKLEDS